MANRSLSIYRKVLRANRLLPLVQRSLADRLVSQEFRNHQSADEASVTGEGNEI